MEKIICKFEQLTLQEKITVNVPLDLKGAVIGRQGRTVKVSCFLNFIILYLYFYNYLY